MVRHLLALVLASLVPAAALAGALDDARAALALHKEGDVDGAVRLYSQAIAADELEPHNLAVAFYNRGNAYSAKRRYDLAIADFDFAVKLNPEYTIAYNNLANAHVAAGDYDRAVAVYDIAIRLRPDYALGYKNRGNAHAAAGRHEAAIADYDTAIGFEPRLASAYNNRGNANFFLGRFADATRDFQAALEIDPSDAYTVLWLYLARGRAGDDGRAELITHAQNLDLDRWPGPIARLYLGSLPSLQVLAAANDPNPGIRRERQCEAYFYLGAYHLMRGARETAALMFHKAVGTRLGHLVEYRGARSELQRIGLAP